MARGWICGELEHRVEREVLQAVPCVELGAGDACLHGVDTALVSNVSVVVRQSEHPTACEEGVIDRPGVDPDADEVAIELRSRADSSGDLSVQFHHVPVQRLPVVLVQGDGSVREARHRCHPDTAAVDVTDDDSAARRAEVDRSDTPRTHRRKAAATPASTGMCRPVVCEKSDVQIAYTAFATFSGTTSRLSIVRCA